MATAVASAAPRLEAAMATGRRRTTWLGLGAYLVLGIPYAIIFLRYLADGSAVYLPDDLALIDLHTRDALAFHQQLGPFDRFGWSHPGPAYFYLLSIPYRIMGSGPRAEFVGAIVIGALAALAIVWVLRRRCGPWAALWGATCVGVVILAMSFAGGSNVTYSESVAGAVVSPWNPTVVVLPTLLVAVLCAAAVAGSPLSLVGAAAVGSFCVQTDISTLPVVGVLWVLSAAAVATGALVARGRRTGAAPAPADGGRSPSAADTAPAVPTHRRPRRFPRSTWWLGVGLVVLVVMWIPPALQQLSNHPGNLTEIERFFTSAHPAHGLSAGLWSVVSVNSVLVAGPSQIMASPLGIAGAHGSLVLALTVVLGLGSLAVALIRRHRLAVALAGAGLVGQVVGIYSVTAIVGPIWGYLLLWELGFPVLWLVALGLVVAEAAGAPQVPPAAAPNPAPSALRRGAPALGALGVAAAVVLCGILSYRMVVIPPLSSVSDPAVRQSVALVTGHLRPDGTELGVQDNGLSLIGTERFIGLVNQLDQKGYQPRVSPFWQAQFGPRLVTETTPARNVVLDPYSPKSPGSKGYLGRVGDIAFILQHRPGGPR